MSELANLQSVIPGSGYAIIVGLLIICAVVVLIIKQYETRMVLIGAGFLMTIAALNPLMAFNAFSSNMVVGALIQNICSALGFAAVLQLTKCDKHLVHALAHGLKYVRPLLIPAAALATYLVNIAIPSAAGCAAAVGVVMIPLLVSQGVHPAVAASAVMLGTFGSTISPGLSHNPVVVGLANDALLAADPNAIKVTSMDFIKTMAVGSIPAFIIGAASLTLVAIFRKEDKGYVAVSDDGTPAPAETEKFVINPFFALLPLLPIVLLIGFSIPYVQGELPWAKSFLVPHAMLLGAFVCLVCTKTSPTKATKDFFNGMGKGYGDVIGIIIAAGVFVGGMSALGLISSAIDALKHAQHVAGIAATFGPFLIAVISGSGDAAAIAFNNAVTAHANEFGFGVVDMGALAALTGSLGRSMSPIAGAAILLAGLAKVNPFEIAKRNAPGMIIATFVAMYLMLYM